MGRACHRAPTYAARVKEYGIVNGPESDWLWEAESTPDANPDLALALETMERALWLDDDPEDD